MIGWRKPKALKGHLLDAKIKRESSSDNKSASCLDLNAKFVLSLRKLTFSKIRIKARHLTLGKGF